MQIEFILGLRKRVPLQGQHGIILFPLLQKASFHVMTQDQIIFDLKDVTLASFDVWHGWATKEARYKLLLMRYQNGIGVFPWDKSSEPSHAEFSLKGFSLRPQAPWCCHTQRNN
jgi:hypothetical protein